MGLLNFKVIEINFEEGASLYVCAFNMERSLDAVLHGRWEDLLGYYRDFGNLSLIDKTVETLERRLDEEMPTGRVGIGRNRPLLFLAPRILGRLRGRVILRMREVRWILETLRTAIEILKLGEAPRRETLIGQRMNLFDVRIFLESRVGRLQRSFADVDRVEHFGSPPQVESLPLRRFLEDSPPEPLVR